MSAEKPKRRVGSTCFWDPKINGWRDNHHRNVIIPDSEFKPNPDRKKFHYIPPVVNQETLRPQYKSGAVSGNPYREAITKMPERVGRLVDESSLDITKPSPGTPNHLQILYRVNMSQIESGLPPYRSYEEIPEKLLRDIKLGVTALSFSEHKKKKLNAIGRLVHEIQNTFALTIGKNASDRIKASKKKK